MMMLNVRTIMNGESGRKRSTVICIVWEEGNVTLVVRF
jgi:hypothetical protein